MVKEFVYSLSKRREPVKLIGDVVGELGDAADPSNQAGAYGGGLGVGVSGGGD